MSVAVVTSVVMVTALPSHVLRLRRFIFLQAVILFRCSCELATTQFDPSLVEYCHWESFEASCPADEVIVVKDAFYGRMRHGRCIRPDYEHVGCYRNIRTLVDARCSGRRSCRIVVPDEQLDKILECRNDLRFYLLAGYDCLKVSLPTGGQCKATSTSIEAADHGVLASIVSASTVCGSPKSPWLIEVHPGKIVNITLVDFSLQQFDVDPTYSTSHCHVIVIIREKTTMKTETVCGGGPEGLPHGREWRREKNVFLSDHNVVEVRFNVEKIISTDSGHFLLMYQAVGCPDPDMKTYGWSKRSGQNATIGCSANSPEMWHVTCHGTRWIGHVGNCSSWGGTEGNARSVFSISHIAAAYVIMSIAIVVGIAIFIIGFRILRQKRQCARDEIRYDINDKPVCDYWSVKLTESRQRSCPAAVVERKNTYDSDDNDYAYVDELHLPGSYRSSGALREFTYGTEMLNPSSEPRYDDGHHGWSQEYPLADERRNVLTDVHQYFTIDRGSHVGSLPKDLNFRCS